MPKLPLNRREVLALGATALSAATPAAATAAAPPGVERPAPLPMIDRAFLRLDEGLVHYRQAGRRSRRATPLYLAHAGPGSSRAFEGLMPSLAQRRFAIAPDMLGNGDSAPPARDDVDISYYVDCVVRILDLLKMPQVDFYGSHTGAQIGCQLAVSHPQRVRRLILDGIPLFTDAFKAQLLANYAPAIRPDDHGGHLIWAWNFVRDQSLYWPHFDRRAVNRLHNPVAAAEQLQASVADVVKALRSYHIAYRAAFAQNLHALLPQLRVPVLMMASERDPLHVYLDEASALVPQAAKVLLPRSATLADRLAHVENFLASNA
jgi:pimeloyl-ACP methyl ester carboxylesterase